jgi:hypothetical protein
VLRSPALALAIAAVMGSIGPVHAQQQQKKPGGYPPYVTVPPPPQPGVKQPQSVCPCYRGNGVYAGYSTAACCFRR